MKVLIIEDDPTDMKLMGAVLKMSGHIVGQSTSAEEAVDAIAADKPDIILLDLRLPGIDGLTFLRQLRAKAETRPIPVVAVTAYPDRYRRDEMLAAGCDAWIAKPIDTRDLPGTLVEVATKKSR
jgi:two-component system cell cycle response regulator